MFRLRHKMVLVFVALVLTGCAPARLAAATPSENTAQTAAPTAVPATLPAPTAVPTALSTPTSEPTAAPFPLSPTPYRDEANGFELDYPAGWTITPNQGIGSRGSQAQILSPGTTAEGLAPGGTRVSITIYQWDPKNDLAAYVAQRRTAWDGGGYTIIQAGSGVLSDGRNEMHFVVEAADQQQAYFLFTMLGENYLQIAGDGDLGLIKDIALTFRPIK
jgi:hypothetical protein